MTLRGMFVKAQSADPRLAQLKRQLSDFYANNTGYYEQAESDKDYVYHPLLRMIEAKQRALGRPLRILELGAARTSFPAYLRRHAPGLAVSYLAYDINDTNLRFYAECAIDCVIGDYALVDARGPFDLCFSTAVYEHLVEPHRFLDVMARNLAPSGALVISCPKYVFPGYVPPAIRWLPRWRQHAFTCFLSLANLWAVLSGKPNFLICTEPAILRLPYRRDFDAVHMVSSGDLRAALKPDFAIRPLRLQRGDLRGRMLDRLMMMSIIAERKTSPRDSQTTQ
jgi:SAM-dependent methyltransferase